MSIFCSLDEKNIKELKDSENKFQSGIKKLSGEEKDYLLMYMYKARHNLLINLTEERNKNICLIVISAVFILNRILNLF